jgi:hypothetical protein
MAQRRATVHRGHANKAQPMASKKAATKLKQATTLQHTKPLLRKAGGNPG